MGQLNGTIYLKTQVLSSLMCEIVKIWRKIFILGLVEVSWRVSVWCVV